MRMIAFMSKTGSRRKERRSAHYPKTKPYKTRASRAKVTVGQNPSTLRHGNRKFRH